LFNRARFHRSTTIDNRRIPLLPGTELILKGHVTEGKTSTPHSLVTIVTDLTKVIDGVRTVVVWERDFDAGQLAESELFFEAQDDAGNVWNLGEFPADFDGAVFTGAPKTWIAGVSRGARPGILMLGQPQVGTPQYSEGFAPTVGFNDVARVARTGVDDVCVPVRCFDNVLVIDESSPNDPTGGHQLKSYAAGVGNILTTPVGGDQQETLALTRLSHLGEDDREAVCQQALTLERRAYQVSTVYQQTPHATPRPGACR
jgi:hypothetical protein